MEVVEEDIEAGRIDGVELFFLTENYVVETVYYRGNSSDKDILELMLWLVYLDLRRCFRLHIIWVAGTIEIVEGADGFSRGWVIDKIDSYGSILDFVPLYETNFDCSASLLPWVQT